MNESEKSAGHEPAKNEVVHEVDGIKEMDNKLPNWWLNTLFGSIVFAVGYWFYYEQAAIGKLPRAEYEVELDKKRAEEGAKIRAAGKVTDESLLVLVSDKATVSQGKDVFEQTCVACHRQDGGGNVGPNLTDAYWLHGSANASIFQTVQNGVVDKGMPAWGPTLGIDKTLAVAAYVITLKGKNAPGGKAPQGVIEKAP